MCVFFIAMRQQKRGEQAKLPVTLNRSVFCLATTENALWVGANDGVWHFTSLSVPAAQYSTRAPVTSLTATPNTAFFATENRALYAAFANGRHVDLLGYPDTAPYDPSRDRVNDLAIWNGMLVVATSKGLFCTPLRGGNWSEPLVETPIYYLLPTRTDLWAFGTQTYRFNPRRQLVDQAPIAMRMRPVFYQGRLYTVDSTADRVILQVYSPGSKRLDEYMLPVSRKDRPFLEGNQASLLHRANGAWYVGFAERAYLANYTFCFCPAPNAPCAVARWRAAMRDFDIIWSGDGLQAIDYWRGHLIVGSAAGLYQVAQ